MTARGYELDDALRDVLTRLREMDIRINRNRPSTGSSYSGTGSGSASTNVQDAIDELFAAIAALPPPTGFLTVDDGGGGTVQAHGAMGATETLDLANGNYHTGTLTANCDITLTTIAGVAERWFTAKLTEDGTGGWTPSFVGSGTVVRIDGSPAHDTTAGTTTFYAGWSDDGGTTWYVGMIGANPGLTIEDEGTPLATSATTLDFVGDGVTASGTGAGKTITISGAPTGAASGDLAGTYPSPTVVDDSHSHTGATLTTGAVGPILVTDTPAGTPLVFADLLQNEAGTDLLYADV